ncbi:MAG: hypothetical protein D6685_02380 [Bacteroidetes bacterium]|nr:MAG: hypothetical protein D6685_02380 [Bacteroidota bacterium]
MFRPVRPPTGSNVLVIAFGLLVLGIVMHASTFTLSYERPEAIEGLLADPTWGHAGRTAFYLLVRNAPALTALLLGLYAWRRHRMATGKVLAVVAGIVMLAASVRAFLPA